MNYKADCIQTFSPSSSGIAKLKVTAYDLYSSESIEYYVKVQDPVLNISLTTLPNATSTMLADSTRLNESKTVVFNINLNTFATEPYYIIDYGDGSSIENANIFNQSSGMNLTHVYPSSGIYVANITIFNQVSQSSVLKEVILF